MFHKDCRESYYHPVRDRLVAATDAFVLASAEAAGGALRKLVLSSSRRVYIRSLLHTLRAILAPLLRRKEGSLRAASRIALWGLDYRDVWFRQVRRGSSDFGGQLSRTDHITCASLLDIVLHSLVIPPSSHLIMFCGIFHFTRSWLSHEQTLQ